MGEANHWRINITCPRCGYNADVDETFPCGHGPELQSLVKACRATLLFHSGGPWTEERSAEWLQLTGGQEATTKVLGDLQRAALALAGKP